MMTILLPVPTQPWSQKQREAPKCDTNDKRLTLKALGKLKCFNLELSGPRSAVPLAVAMI